MDTSQWPPQEFVVKPIGSLPYAPKPSPTAERKPRPQKEQALNCPRCNSTNTKFCYYNNYSLTQPRYFCKGCRRYWTEGGSLRNIPVGGGSRKHKRSSSSSSKKLPDLSSPSASNVGHENSDLNLGFPFQKLVATSDVASGQVSAIELLSGITGSSSRALQESFLPMPVPDPVTVYESGFGFADFKSSLRFSLDFIGTGGGGFRSLHHDMHDGSRGRMLFPFEDPKSASSNIDHGQQDKETGDDTKTGGYWTGMLGGRSW